MAGWECHPLAVISRKPHRRGKSFGHRPLTARAGGDVNHGLPAAGVGLGLVGADGGSARVPASGSSAAGDVAAEEQAL
jgi:hypothetical protein